VSEHLRRVPRGVRGGVQRPRFFFFGPTYFRRAELTYFRRADIFPGRHISGTTYYRDDIFPGPHDIRWFFGTWFFANGFLFLVKELGFWTNPGHWVRVLDAAGSYMYIVL
jgi:hypothetical protein